MSAQGMEGERDLTPEEQELTPEERKGPLAWFARNSVAANIVMILLLVGGTCNLGSIRQEVFPAFDLDMVLVQLTYPGAGPEEVEQGGLLAVEEAVRAIDGVKEVRSAARENVGVATIVLKRGEDAKQKLNEVKAAIDQVTSFPESMERPNVFLALTQFEVISIVLSGEQSEKTLRAFAEEVRDTLLLDERVSVAELADDRAYEISIEVSQENLRRYGLTLEQIAEAVKRASVELPGGGVKTGKGEVLIRTTERRLRGHEFERIALISRPDGTTVTVADIATVKDAFTEVDSQTQYNGKPAVMLRVFRTGDEKPLDVAAAVHELVAKKRGELPEGIHIDTWFDNAVFYEQRLDLLSRNALMGLVLVILVLGLFLDVKLAFWVTLGIPVSFLGAFLFLPSTDVSVNMISLFAFIQVLGMVVDDAIVIGESVYLRRQAGMPPLKAAIAGVREVAVPVVFAVITTVVMYMPMLFMSGIMGKFFRVIPVVVITVLLISLLESLVVLPAHLAHSKPSRFGLFGWIHRGQQRFSRWFERQVAIRYAPLLDWVLKNRYLTLAGALAVLMISFGLLGGGKVKTIDMPDIDSDVIVVGTKLSYGVSMAQSQEVEKKISDAAERIFEELGGRDQIVVGMYSQIGAWAMIARTDLSGAAQYDRGAHLIETAIFMKPSGQRPVTASRFAQRWREELEDVVGIDSLTFNYAMGPASGPAVHVNLSHKDYATLQVAAADLAEKLKEFEGAYDVDDGFEEGKEQLDFELTREGQAAGLTEASLAMQLRGAFFGAEAVRQQRGRDEVRTYVRLPRDERESEFNLEEFMLRTPTGGEIPLLQAATMKRGRSYTRIGRRDGQRVLSVTSYVDTARANAGDINSAVVDKILPEMMQEIPGLTYTMGGAEQEMADANKSLVTGFMLALLGVYALLAVAFRSYAQPILIMLIIPFGFVGAILGHLITGYDFSMMSRMGVIALSGVVVNDSLVFIVAINELRARGMAIREAVIQGGVRRFRPILLTSLTTFLGLAPMLLETEVQAQFLVPMAVSLGFGVMVATALTLVLLPATYVILDDAKRFFAAASRVIRGESATDKVPEVQTDP